MKKKITSSIIVCLLTALTTNSFSQETKDIILNFSDKTIDISEVDSLNEGDFYRLIINNINLNLYSVQINFSDTIYSKPLETPTFTNFEIDAISKAITNLSDLSTSVVESRKDYEKGINMLEMYVSDFPKDTVDNNDEYQKLKALINQENQKLKSINSELNNISLSIVEFKLSVSLFRLNSLKTDNQNDIFNLDKELKKSLNIRESIINLKIKAKDNTDSYVKEYKKYSEEIRKKEDIKKAHSELKATYEKLITILDKTMSEINAYSINTQLSQIVFFENNSNKTYKSVPIQFKGDQAILEYKIIPRDEKYLLQSYNAKILFPQRKSNYISIGLSFYYSTLHDEAYSAVGIPINDSSNIYNVVKEEDLSGEIGMVSLFRIGKKFETNNYWGFHFNFGPGVSISNNVKPRLLFGVGISYGKRHNFALDLGGITGYVDVLSNSVDINGQYSIKPDKMTVSKLKFGEFISLGYYYTF